MTTEDTRRDLSALSEGLGLVPERAGVEGWVREWFAARYGDGNVFNDGAEALTLDGAVAFYAAAVAAERERCAALCRRVGDETRNSEDARSAGRMLANWISTGVPVDPGRSS